MFTYFLPCPTDSDKGESEKSDKDDSYAPSNHDSDGSENDSSNEDSSVGSGDETHDYNTYSGVETDQVEQTSPRGSSSDEGKFYEYSYRMFYISRFAANSIVWNARPKYFNGIFIMFLATFI